VGVSCSSFIVHRSSIIHDVVIMISRFKVESYCKTIVDRRCCQDTSFNGGVVSEREEFGVGGRRPGLHQVGVVGIWGLREQWVMEL
jgi:hypothetical protein